MLTGGNETGLDQRLGRRRGGDDDVGTGCRVSRIRLGAHHDAQPFAQAGGGRLGLGCVARPDTRFLDRPDKAQGFQLQAGLQTGAEDRGHGRVFARQMLGRDSAGGGRADIGQIAIVEQQRLDHTGLR